jgi:DNA invertase Pin-like site-specific DNA recombinase
MSRLIEASDGECGPGDPVVFDPKGFVAESLGRLKGMASEFELTREECTEELCSQFQSIFCCQNYISWYHFAMSNTVAIYARTSPDCTASAEAQIERLKTVAAKQGWSVSRVFIDRPMPVQKGREKRPGETALLEAIRSGGVAKVMVWSIDRVGRTLVDLVRFLETCRTVGVTLWLDDRKLDTATANGMSLFDLSGMLAYHLRQMRRDRILRGQAAVKGLVRFGRPPIPVTKAAAARHGLASGKGVSEVARLAGISASAASRLKKSGLFPGAM